MPVFESEKEFEDVLMDNQEILSGEFGGDYFERQVKLFGYGTADIIGVHTEHDDLMAVMNINIYELKIGKIDFNAIGQVCRYVKAVKRFVRKNKRPSKLSGLAIHVSGIVIGSKMGSGDVCYLSDAIEDVSAYSYKIDAIDGLVIHAEEDWFQTGEQLVLSNTKQIRALLKSFNMSKRFHEYEKDQARNEH